MNPKQIEAVLALPGLKRVEHFVKRVVDSEQVWGLFSDGWALAETGDGQRVFPMWPDVEYARMCAAGDWEGFFPKYVTLAEVTDVLLSRMTLDGTRAAVFPTPGDKGVVMSPEDLGAMLRSEAANYS